MEAAPAIASGADARAALDVVLALARDAGRDDFAERLSIAIARITRPAAIVCVVGEFKQGKSSLVNALLDLEVCPVDDDIATSVVTLVRYGAELSTHVRRRDGGQSVVETIPPSELRAWVTEEGNRGNEKGVERVDILAPASLLERGLVVVDTPGMGGLGAGQAATTLAFLPFADGLVLVTDASAELSAPEAELLQQAVERCPTVVVALTKTDLHPHWRRLADVDRAHLARLDSDAPVIPVSSVLHAVAVERADPELDALSGIPDFVAVLRERVEIPAKTLAARRAVAESETVLGQLRGAVQAELDVLGDPAAAQASMAAFEQARQHLEHLKGPGARWSVLVADRIADLSNDMSFRFRGALRNTVRTVEDEIETMKTPKQWEELSRRLQTMVADAVAAAFATVQQEGDAIRDAVVDLLAEETLELPPLPRRDGTTDPRSLWIAKRIDPESGRMASTLTGLRGAQSGILMFGMMSQFLPGGVAAFLALSPITLGIGAAFAGVQLVDAHKRKIQQRRMAARANLRQFVDDVQFEVTNELGEALRLVQRSIRDEFTERMSELQRTYADLARQAHETAGQDQAGRDARLATLRSAQDRIDKAEATLASLGR